MKTLQKNFTTPKQSKRLLELGVPADSADFCYTSVYDKNYDKSGSPSGWKPVVHSIFIATPDWSKHHDYPCWSVGRLIEIMALCYKFDLPGSGSISIYVTDVKKGSVVDVLISDIERFISKLDFSKLEG